MLSYHVYKYVYTNWGFDFDSQLLQMPYWSNAVCLLGFLSDNTTSDKLKNAEEASASSKGNHFPIPPHKQAQGA